MAKYKLYSHGKMCKKKSCGDVFFGAKKLYELLERVQCTMNGCMTTTYNKTDGRKVGCIYYVCAMYDNFCSTWHNFLFSTFIIYAQCALEKNFPDRKYSTFNSTIQKSYSVRDEMLNWNDGHDMAFCEYECTCISLVLGTRTLELVQLAVVLSYFSNIKYFSDRIFQCITNSIFLMKIKN